VQLLRWWVAAALLGEARQAQQAQRVVQMQMQRDEDARHAAAAPACAAGE